MTVICLQDILVQTATNVMGVTNQELNWIEGLPHDIEPLLDPVSEVKSPRLDRSQTLWGKKLTLFFFSNEFSNKITPSSILLYL